MASFSTVGPVVVETRLVDDEGYGSGASGGMGTLGTKRRAGVWGGWAHEGTPLSYLEPTLLVNWLENLAFIFPSSFPFLSSSVTLLMQVPSGVAWEVGCPSPQPD